MNNANNRIVSPVPSTVPTPDTNGTGFYTSDRSTTAFPPNLYPNEVASPYTMPTNDLVNRQGMFNMNDLLNATHDESNDACLACSDCVHKGVCKFEDKLGMVYTSIMEKTSGHKFIDSIKIICKYHKSNVTNFGPYYRTPDQGLTLDVDHLGSVCTTPNLVTPGKIDGTITTTIHPKFDANPDVNSASDIAKYSKNNIVTATNDRAIDEKKSPISTFGVTDDKGEHKSITTKVLGSSKKAMNVPKADLVLEDEVTANTQAVVSADELGVPVKAIDPNDVPKQFQSTIMDGTHRAEIPGQTSNV